MTAINIRPYGVMAIHSHIEYYPGYPYSCNSNGIEITVVRLITVPHIHIFGIYRSPGKSPSNPNVSCIVWTTDVTVFTSQCISG